MRPSPQILMPAAFDHFYRGGTQLAAFRGTEAASHRPEEWLGSTVTRVGQATEGLTVLDGIPLRDLIAADPEGWLGVDHVSRFGVTPGLLTKLLDPGQRLPVHIHPTRRFAERHLDCPFGKAEAWVVLEGIHGGGTVFLGTTRPVRHEEWTELVSARATSEMLSLLHPVEVSPGDSVFVPSGTPHAIDAHTFVLEVQEPTDWSILLEWNGFDIDAGVDWHLGLGMDIALQAVRPDSLDPSHVETLIRRVGLNETGKPRNVLPHDAAPYFRVWRLDARPSCLVPMGFGVLLITAGSGRLAAEGVRMSVSRGAAVVVPAAAQCVLEGEVEAYLAQPAAPDAPSVDEWDAPQFDHLNGAW